MVISTALLGRRLRVNYRLDCPKDTLESLIFSRSLLTNNANFAPNVPFSFCMLCVITVRKMLGDAQAFQGDDK